MTPAARRRRAPTARIALLVTVAAAVLVMHSFTAASAPAHDGSLHAVAASYDPGTNHGHDCTGNECEQSHPNGHHCAGVVVVAPALTRATVPCVAGAEAPSPTSRVSVDRVQSGRGPPAWTVLSLAQLSILRV